MARRVKPGKTHKVARGDVRLYTFAQPDKRRPVVVLSRDDVIGLLHTVTVAPITSTVRGAPSEVMVGVGEGLKHDSAVNLDHIQTVPIANLGAWLGCLSAERMRDVCRGLGIALGCR